MKITTRIVLATALGMQLGTVCIGQEVDRMRMLEAENAMLRATVKKQAARIAELEAVVKRQAAQITRLKTVAEAARAVRVAELKAAAKRPVTRRAAKAAPGVKILSLSDLVTAACKAQAPNLTEIQREAIPKSVIGRWAKLSVSVIEVSLAQAGMACVEGVYRSARATPAPGWPEPAVVHLLLHAYMPVGRAAKISKGTKIVMVGKIRSFRAGSTSRRSGDLQLIVELNARKAPPAEAKAP